MLRRALLGAATAAVILSAATAAGGSPAFAAGPGGGAGCTGFRGGGGWWVTCQGGGTPGGGSGSSGGRPSSCFWTSQSSDFPAGFLKFAPKPPRGYIYLVQVCGSHGQFTSLPQLFANGGALTPQALAQRAYQELRPPLPAPRTAPPRGSDGLVGLPEWFWVPAAQWAPVTAQVAVGRVWAQVTATPRKLTFSPGAGLPAVLCPGPGTAYNPAQPAGAQHSNCTFTYAQSSDGLRGAAYAASVTITWDAAWRGSGNTGGTLPALTRTTTFTLPVAETQALTGTAG
jgi:hypothetical protein